MQPVRQLMGYSAAGAHSAHPLVDNTPSGGQHVRGRQVASRGAVDGKVTVAFDGLVRWAPLLSRTCS